MKKARIINGKVQEVVSIAAFDTFNAALQAACVNCPDDTVVGMLYSGGVFSPGPVVPPGPTAYPSLTPMQFYLAFAPLERVAIKTHTDVVVKEFWETFSLALQTGTPIDPNLPSVSGGLDYLVTKSVIAQGRVEDILRGIAQ